MRRAAHYLLDAEPQMFGVLSPAITVAGIPIDLVFTESKDARCQFAPRGAIAAKGVTGITYLLVIETRYGLVLKF